MLLVSRTCATLAACSSQRARAPNVCVALSLLVPELSNDPWRGNPPRASAAAHGGVRVGRVDGDDAVLDAELARDPPERLRDPTAYLSTSLASLSWSTQPQRRLLRQRPVHSGASGYCYLIDFPVETLVYEPAFVPVWQRRQYLLARPHGHSSGGVPTRAPGVCLTNCIGIGLLDSA